MVNNGYFILLKYTLKLNMPVAKLRPRGQIVTLSNDVLNRLYFRWVKVATDANGVFSFPSMHQEYLYSNERQGNQPSQREFLPILI
jgi:hypothetical protein